MLRLEVSEREFFDETIEEFVVQPSMTLELEHSLVSLSKWESIFEKPFLKDGEKTDEEVLAYIQCMNVAPEDLPMETVLRLDDSHLQAIHEYIERKMTGTTFPNERPGGPSETISAELVYYWMFSLGIPKECEHWHLKKLLTLIKVFNVKNAPPEKRAPQEIAESRRELNARRKAELKTRG